MIFTLFLTIKQTWTSFDRKKLLKTSPETRWMRISRGKAW
jgi:hypothetical protein